MHRKTGEAMGIGCLFFKYRGIDANTLSSLATGKVWFSPPSQLNDPFDCAPNVIRDIAERQLDELLALFVPLKSRRGRKAKEDWVEKSLFQQLDQCGVFDEKSRYSTLGEGAECRC